MVSRTKSRPIPTIGRIVHYTLSVYDAEQINRRRTTGASIAERMLDIAQRILDGLSTWPAGAQAHIGNHAKEGDVFPMIIVKVWGHDPTSCVNGQVFLDGTDVLWATSVAVGEGPRTFSWPLQEGHMAVRAAADIGTKLDHAMGYSHGEESLKE
jgi:hypothetical protein